MKNKRGSAKSVILIIALIIIGLGLAIGPIIYKYYSDTKISSDKVIAEQQAKAKLDFKSADTWGKTEIIAGDSWSFLKNSVLGFKDKYNDPIMGEWNKLGDFIHYFWIGFLAGLWIYIVTRVASTWGWITVKISRKTGARGFDEYKRVRGTWMYFVAGSLWKILIVAMVYGIVMLIPIINSFIKVITLEVLMPNSWFIASFIVAFYIGFGPAAIEGLVKYRLRMRYYKQLMQVKYGVKTAKAMNSG